MIIFDLDDTLIDTTASVRGKKLKDAFDRMCKHGLAVAPAAVMRLLAIDTISPSVQESLTLFLDEVGGNEELLEIAKREYYENISDEIPIKAMESAKEILEELGKVRTIALVSTGIEEQQLSKLERSGLGIDLFHHIQIIPSRVKMPVYEALLKEIGAMKAYVCGDKIDVDLAPAKELGCTTIHMRHGRSVAGGVSPDIVDHTISELSELKNILPAQ